MADLCYIFINIIKWFLKSPACFRSRTKTIWIEVKAIWPSHITQSISGIKFEHETTGNMQCIQYVNIPTHPILDKSDIYVASPDITTLLQSQASLSSHVYTDHAVAS